MAFWDEGSIDPKRKFRFLIDFGSANILLPTWVVKKVDKPGFTVGEAKHNFLSHTFYYPGKVEWKEINVSIVDPRGRSKTETNDNSPVPDISENITKLLLYSGYQLPQNTGLSVNGNQQNIRLVSKFKSTTPFSQMNIRQIDDDGKPLETWILKNAWVKDVNLGSLEYGADDLLEIQLKFRYDWAELAINNGDVLGANTDRDFSSYPKG
jgi:hypothetical protein